MDRRPLSPNVFPLIRQSGACAQHHRLRCHQNASLWERRSPGYRDTIRDCMDYFLKSAAFSVAFNFYGGEEALACLKWGRVFAEASPGYLVRNKRTQARSTDIQKLLGDCPYLFLPGGMRERNGFSPLDFPRPARRSRLVPGGGVYFLAPQFSQ